MYTFFFEDDLWRYDARRISEARARGRIFSSDEFAAILANWATVAAGAPAHQIDRLTLPVQSGEVRITPNGVQFSHEPTDAELRAAVAHIAEHWGGRASIPVSPDASREFRLRARAYAEVYGIELDDHNEGFRDGALTSDELARLPALREAIRARHRDAPPPRSDEASRVAAMYRARYPYRIPRAA